MRTLKNSLPSDSKWLLTQGNTELAADGIFTWTLPALATKLSDGRNLLVCPSAGACAQLCYARSGTYQFSNVKAAHVKNLEMVVNDLTGWERRMTNELVDSRYHPTYVHAPFFNKLDFEKLPEYALHWAIAGGKAVRIHDSGDFFSREYYEAWRNIAKKIPYVLFYAYTKEVALTKSFPPLQNFILIYSMGGKQDHLVDKEKDRHADVFPTLKALNRAGYTDQEHSDVLAALLPTTKIGIVANNIAHYKKKQGDATFASLQEERDGKIAR